MPSLAAATAAPPLPTRKFGRYELRRLLGKSDATMVWLGIEARSGVETLLTMPRVPPAGAAGASSWLAAARRAARLDHPDIGRVAACDLHENWPYIAVDRSRGVTLDEWLAGRAKPTVDEAAGWVASLLRGLAFAHEAGVAHHDLQTFSILIDERGQASLTGLVAGLDVEPGGAGRPRIDRGVTIDAGALREHRAAAERDVLATGLLLHRLLAGEPPLASADTRRVIDRMAPNGREFVRLPWTTPLPVPEALRAIVNRSTAGQERLRYRNARTFLGAVTGWREAAAVDTGGPVALLLDRLRSVGHLPALPGLSTRVQRITAIETQRTDDIASHLLPDLALSFELLRTLNSAHVQGTQIPGNGAVLTLRRVVALIGVNGVREASNTLRTWPGPLDDAGEKAMQGAIDRVRLAGHTAQALRPAGYDGEVTYLVAALQNLGRLLLRYHFADEAAQIQQLMQPAPTSAGEAEQPGLDEPGAAWAVLGVDIETLGSAVARHWGFGDEVMHMIRRLPPEAPVRKPDGDADVLRLVASLANEAVDVISDLPANRVSAALAQVAQRYARVLRIDAKALAAALQEARGVMRSGRAAPAGRAAAADARDARDATAASAISASTKPEAAAAPGV